ncbi:hypothetical protein GETHLI_08160 [Geothrix limicola]|uniref:Uncharacterized protein n=1 Tax=Geothrix limicola TaxID=2927978 RepID=A0ABQ5QE43_9BACT|nr:hypothetical protein [Geothrix limicola]GLH72314.1 hypothetical protein GETHLI_08160 [Geothrix limicola]
MAKSVTRKAEPVSKSEGEGGVVRTTRVIPAIKRLEHLDEEEPLDLPPSLPCSGRCGHCDCHPCRLHAPI